MFFFRSRKVNPALAEPRTRAPFIASKQEHKKLSYRLESKLGHEFNHDAAALDGTTGAGSSAVEASIVVTSRTAQGDRPLVSPRRRVLEAHSGTKFILK